MLYSARESFVYVQNKYNLEVRKKLFNVKLEKRVSIK